MLVVLSMKIRFRSTVCSFAGKHVFSVYIMQRLVFSITQKYVSSPYMLFAIALILTMSVAVVFDSCRDLLWMKRQ